MDKLRLANLENLLRLNQSDDIVSDTSVLTCGCLTSESYFNRLDKNECPTCGKHNVTILAEVVPLRLLYKILMDTSTTQQRENRRSFSKKSFVDEKGGNVESMNLISLFYKFAKEESEREEVPKKRKSVDRNLERERDDETAVETSWNPPQSAPSQSQSQSQSQRVIPSTQTRSQSISALLLLGSPTSGQPLSVNEYNNSNSIGNKKIGGIPSTFNSFAISTSSESTPATLQTIVSQGLLGKTSEQQEYNFSKCFPFYRKLLQFPTQQIKLNFSSISSTLKSSSMIKRTNKFICSSIHSHIDQNGDEITRFVLMTEKKWELYEYEYGKNNNSNSNRPRMICCGKLTGEYGRDYNDLQFNADDSEIVIRNDFGGETNHHSTDTESGEEIKKRLTQWDQVFCCLSTNYLTISGTKGILRILDVSTFSLGKPLYTYITNFPIRCVQISPNESVVACGITARERVSGKEQPFIVIHKLTRKDSDGVQLQSVEPITITIPYRDPIKIMTFNSNSKYLLCVTVWESRYLIIRLTNSNTNDNYRKPRLIWSELSKSRKRSVDNNTDNNKEENEIMMGDEGITDLQFGSFHSNTIISASCSLTNRPPTVIRLDGVTLDNSRPSIGGTGDWNATVGGGMGAENSSLSTRSRNMELEEENNTNNLIKSSEVILRIPEVGSSIHRFALLPRGDGMCYLDKDGHIFLVSTPNFQLHPSSQMKKIVVQLGEVANAERYTESASIIFSSDGGKFM